MNATVKPVFAAVEAIPLPELAERIGAAERELPSTAVRGIATLSQAGPDQISFMSDATYRPMLEATRAAAVILHPKEAAACPVPALSVDNPRLGYALVTRIFYPSPPVVGGIDDSAVIAAGASVHPGAYIGPCAVVAEGAVIGAGCHIGAGSIVDAGVVVGDGCRLTARVTLLAGTRLGNDVIIHPGTVIGADGFGFVSDGKRWLKVPQTGGVCISDDVEIGANVTIDCGALDDTVIGEGVKLDDQVHIGHNVSIGARTVISGYSAVAGSVNIGADCLFGGACLVADHVDIADRVTLYARTQVRRSIKQSGRYAGEGINHNRWMREYGIAKGDLLRRIRVLEHAVTARCHD